MLSKEAEKFLLNLRLELISRGKREKDIQEIEEELRDHLIEAEANGQSVESITGNSVKAYIRSISEELPQNKGFIKYSILLLVYLLGVFIIPDLISGDFELNTSVILYNLAVLIIGTAATIISLKKIVQKYGDSKKNLHRTVFILCSLHGCSGRRTIYYPKSSRDCACREQFYCKPYYRSYSLKYFHYCHAYLEAMVFGNIYILNVSANVPEIIGKISTGGSILEGESYLIISGIILIAVNITVMGILMYTSKKEDKKISH